MEWRGGEGREGEGRGRQGSVVDCSELAWCGV